MRRLLLILFVLLWPATSFASVRISFHSRDFGEYYPHALIVLKGTVDETGEAVDTNFGWTSTAANVLVALGGKVRGVVDTADAKYMSKTIENFSFTLTDAEYRAVMDRVEAWRNLPQPSYSLNTNNCVHFVADIARMLGLRADPKQGLMLKPKSYLISVREDNREQISSRDLPRQILAAPAPAPNPPTQPATPATLSIQAAQTVQTVQTPIPPALVLY